MLLSIKEMEVRPRPFDHTWQPGEIDFTDSATRQMGPLVASGVAELVEHTGGQVRVRGEVKADLEADCDRCLGPAKFHIETDFDLFYQPVGEAVGEDEVAVDESEVEIGFYELPGLELEDILREQLLLQLPMQRVCKESCKGICAVCGGNRNENACNCPTKSGDDRWQALQSLRIETDAQ
jgi:uncharacterized protein